MREVDVDKIELPITFEGMIERTIAFLQGDGEIPGYCRNCPDDETLPMVPQLVELNRRGFLTTCSQPGKLTTWTLDPGVTWRDPRFQGVTTFKDRQRSFVEGYAHDDVAYRIWHRGNELDLCINECDLKTPHVPRGERGIPVTYRNGHASTYVGRFPVRFPWSRYTGVPLEEGDDGVTRIRDGFDLTVPEPWRSRLSWIIVIDPVWERPAHTKDGILTKLLSCLEPSS
jgi:hypothetical protein